MTKGPVTRVVVEPPQEAAEGFDDITAECHLCGEEHVGFGVPVMLMMPGMIFPSTEYDAPVFIPDPDAQFRVVQMPNGQLGLVTDQTTTKYSHAECVEDLIDEISNFHEEPDPTDDDED